MQFVSRLVIINNFRKEVILVIVRIIIINNFRKEVILVILRILIIFFLPPRTLSNKKKSKVVKGKALAKSVNHCQILSDLVIT